MMCSSASGQGVEQEGYSRRRLKARSFTCARNRKARDGAERTIRDRSGQGRILLPPSELPGAVSEDAKYMVYQFRANGANHIGIVTLATGAKRPLTHAADE